MFSHNKQNRNFQDGRERRPGEDSQRELQHAHQQDMMVERPPQYPVKSPSIQENMMRKPQHNLNQQQDVEYQYKQQNTLGRMPNPRSTMADVKRHHQHSTHKNTELDSWSWHRSVNHA